MKTYMLQTMPSTGNRWNLWYMIPNDGDPLTSNSIKYMRGFQDGLHFGNPSLMTRIVEVRGSRYVEVRRCANWSPC